VQFMVNWFEFLVEFFARLAIKSSVNNLIDSVNKNIQNEMAIPNTNSTIKIKHDKIAVDESHLDLSTKFNFKHSNLGKRNLEMLEENDDDTEDLRIFVNHDLMNSLSKAFYLANVFSTDVTSELVPDEIPFKINTKFFKLIIPGIYEKYPDQELRINLKTTELPTFLFNKNNQSIEFATTAMFTFSLLNDTLAKSIFSFDSDVFFDLRLGSNYSDPSIHLSIKNLTILEMSIINSEFPPLDIELLRSNLNFTFEIICNAANKFYLVKGIPLPIVKGLKFKKAVVQVEDNFFSLTIQPDMTTSDFSWLKLY